MRKEERRKKIILQLSKSDSELSGEKLAESFKVTRQVIVQDIAVLRSMGYPIISMARGYMLAKDESGIKKVVAVKHDKDRIREELTTIVENGGRVVNVIVEHPIYGEITGNIDVRTHDDIEKFLGMLETASAVPLLSLSNGVHLHTIQAKDKETMQRIIDALEEKKFILK